MDEPRLLKRAIAVERKFVGIPARIMTKSRGRVLRSIWTSHRARGLLAKDQEAWLGASRVEYTLLDKGIEMTVVSGALVREVASHCNATGRQKG